jgi:hypothetical protein
MSLCESPDCECPEKEAHRHLPGCPAGQRRSNHLESLVRARSGGRPIIDGLDTRNRIRTVRWAEYLARQIENRVNSPKTKKRQDGEEMDIDADYLRLLWVEQEGRCYWFGIPMVAHEGVRDLRRPSVDRVDTKRGYTRGNIVLCCMAANFCRNDCSPSKFEAFVKVLKRSPPCPRKKGFDYYEELRKPLEEEDPHVEVEDPRDLAGPYQP